MWLGNITSNTVQIQIGKATNAQNSTSSQWVQEGVEKYQADQYLDAIEDWNKALDIEKNNRNPRNKAIIIENLARAYQQVGQTENAIKHWENVVQLHNQLGDAAKVGHSLTELAQVYTSYGQPKKAIELLCNPNESNECQTGTSVKIAQQNVDIEGEVAALGSLGDAYQLFEGCEEEGKCRAIQRLEDSLNKIKEKNKNINNKNYEISILNSLGNIYSNRASLRYRRAFFLEKQESYNFPNLKPNLQNNKRESEKKRQEATIDDTNALNKFKDSYNIAQEIGEKSAKVKVLLSEIPIYYRTKQAEQAKQALTQARKLLHSLPKNSQIVYTYIDFADKLQPTVDNKGVPLNLNRCSQTLNNSPENFNEAQTLLKEAAKIAHKIKDSRAESFALGKLGKLFECNNKYDAALAYTQQAREVIEQNLAAKDSLFLWEWQAARILKQQDKINEAIIAYQNSKNTLEKVRQDILSENRNFQFDFKNEIEPIYRELIALHLNVEAGKKENKLNNQNLLAALETIDSFKIAELQNYFGSDCIITIPNENPKDKQNSFKNKILSLTSDKKTAIFSSIILEDKIAIILTLPNGESKINLRDRETIQQQVIEYSTGLKEDAETKYLKPAQLLYNEIIRDFEQSLTPPINTLVFVQDEIFQSVPMAALHDGNNFLVEKYAIATTPTLLLTDDKNFERKNLQVLALGLTVEKKPFPKLENVQTELDAIPNSTQVKNEKFTRENIKQELSRQIYSVIHIATHGKFGIEPKDTFLVTWDNENFTINQLDRIIRNTTTKQNRIDLLTLTACNTAVGESLGLAGVAIQAGAKSILASLWSIDDTSTSELVQTFYQGWKNPELTKAVALQKAQMALIKNPKYQHPYFWAPFVLVGNWQ
ncbi:hypothetical protein DSM106972_072250 [Dulcicalothrix desertica PCC 7102]|uniref:CHAT domain-containing protein n=1 Tax=Dulcicalothrix desertica PCC 7102 TaxID=232991 RepID=A0A433V3Z9_9CYAN|nr:hypothetical protein DSM106972_072250 [Dulcicalothrix desertica PCC 7102]